MFPLSLVEIKLEDPEAPVILGAVFTLMVPDGLLISIVPPFVEKMEELVEGESPL